MTRSAFILCLAPVLPAYCKALSGPDQHCFHCSSFEEMADILQSRPVDLILSDFLLPGLSLPEVKIFLEEKNFPIPLVAVQDQVQPEDIVTMMAAGAADCVSSGQASHLQLVAAREIRCRQTQQALREQREESVRTVSARLAHDFNNILAPVTMSAPMLKWDLEDAEFDDILDTLEQSTRLGADMIRDLLVFGRGLELHRGEISVPEFLEELIEDFRKNLPPNIHFALHIEKQLPLLWADPDRLQQALKQLLENAREAMPEGGHLDIKASRIHGGKGLVLSLSDEGVGIAPQHLNQIFDPFFSTKRHLKKGSGLGLCLALGIIKSHQGNIQVESCPGKGSTFRIILPQVPN